MINNKNFYNEMKKLLDDKDIYKLMNYINDKLHGEMKVFYKDGKIQSVLTFKEGKRSGDYGYWDENGVKEEEGIFLEDKLHGLITRWYGENKYQVLQCLQMEIYKD